MVETVENKTQSSCISGIGKVLELEKKLGSRNNSVIGGFSSHIDGLLNKYGYFKKEGFLPGNEGFVSSYSKLPNSKRTRLNNELVNLLKIDKLSFFEIDSPKQDTAHNQVALRSDVRYQKFIGSATAAKLKRLKIEKISDLLYHFPHRYLDTSSLKNIVELKEGEEATVIGLVKDIRKHRSKRGVKILNIGIYDGTAYLYGVWFNQDYIADTLSEGVKVAFSGKVNYRYGQLQIENPFYDVIDDQTDVNEDTVHTNRIIPFHPATQNLSPGRMRRIIKYLVDTKTRLPDPLPTALRIKSRYLSRSLSLKEIHFPTNNNFYRRARARLIFEELFLIQVGLAIKKKRFEKEMKGIQHKINNTLLGKFYSSLPFKLTVDQKRVIAEIQEDMACKKPMNRLLQGEVGSGKTIVALATLLTTVENGFQGAIMAPTEVLAEQHYKKIRSFIENLDLNVALLKGSLKTKEKAEIQEKIKTGEIDILIGTHTLVQESVVFKNLGAAVIDEQHRFGVNQRVNLKEKGICPDVLVMTATPIPRTLALTLYGDLDVSMIKELPLGRKLDDHVKTYVCDCNHRESAYKRIRSEIAKGRQAYIVCPLIEESDKLEVKAVTEETERLKNDVFPDLKVELIHGKLKSAEKEEVMNMFEKGLIDILISTTVIEVGIDVPNASVMLIEDADRFGLSQLHQLRGRIGRGTHRSYCILFADPNTDEGKARMEAIINVSDGFQLAEVDLEIRGEGQIFGARQSGMPDLRLARLTRDMDTLIDARRKAFELVENDPSLACAEHKLLLFMVKEQFADRLDWLFHS